MDFVNCNCLCCLYTDLFIRNINHQDDVEKFDGTFDAFTMLIYGFIHYFAEIPRNPRLDYYMEISKTMRMFLDGLVDKDFISLTDVAVEVLPSPIDDSGDEKEGGDGDGDEKKEKEKPAALFHISRRCDIFSLPDRRNVSFHFENSIKSGVSFYLFLICNPLRHGLWAGVWYEDHAPFRCHLWYDLTESALLRTNYNNI